jgi:hypothetical protein
MTAADGGHGLWAKTIETAHKNMTAILAYIGFMMVIGLAQDYMSSTSALTFAQAFVAALLAIPVHLYVLTNQTSPMSLGTKDNKVMWRFIWRGFLLGLIAILPALIVFVVLLLNEAEIGIAILIFALIFSVTSILVFAKWGTMLPASVIGEDHSFAAASARSSKTFGYSVANLCVSFLLLTVLMLGAAMGFASLSGGDGRFIGENGAPDMFAIGGTAIANAIGAFQIVMTAVILSRAFMIAEKAKT